MIVIGASHDIAADVGSSQRCREGRRWTYGVKIGVNVERNPRGAEQDSKVRASRPTFFHDNPLGAAPAQVFGTVLRQVMLVVGVGLALAVPVIWYGSAFVADLLYQIDPRDAWSVTAACVAMMLTALASGAIPARAASQVDPAVTLRAE